MADFDELVHAAERAPIDGWDFSWLDGRATEERPSWRYFDRVVERTANVATLLEIEAGVGAMIGSLPTVPPVAIATEGFPPSLAAARPRLRRRGIHLVATSPVRRELPLVADSFELVICRHPIVPWWTEIARVLRPGGTYFAQHVGPHSLRSLSEHFVGPLPETPSRDPEIERRAAQAAGLTVENLTVERLRTVFSDIGAVVYFLRLVPWIVPGFDVATHRDRLRDLHRLIERDGRFETTTSRMLIDATKPP